MEEILSLYPEELKERLALLGVPAYRASQIFSWLHVKRALSFSEMTDLPKALREQLSGQFVIHALKPVLVQKSKEDGTEKVLFELADGARIESVLMRYHYGASICVSTQVGCRMGCRFCASTIGGLERNLTAGEMISEIYGMERLSGEDIRHLVLMGTGEPFDNYEQVVRFIRLATHKDGKNMSARNVTLSTSGIPDRIRAFAREDLPVTLALSLHASNEEDRKELMPVARMYPLGEVLAACDDYFRSTGRRVTYEYAVISGKNDTEKNVEELRRLLGGRMAHINLIPVNPVREKMMKRPDRKEITAFQNALEIAGIHATIRRSMGTDIDGACGQLRYSAALSDRNEKKGEDRQ
ncbi:MAG: 23S rRNA (adenine(2503)-C(2))-methyltransferase RlmN [Lachnospiraceae bacterium]|nr:23S rRNA (adenine(2503)-C(2))-methyltransferase RlmN [Lachnospiraceae bacterium]